MAVRQRQRHRWLATGPLTAAVLASQSAWPAVAVAREPEADCLAAGVQTWTAQEAWVWERLCAREVADLGDERRFGDAGEVGTADGWSPARALRGDFIEDILTSDDLTQHMTGREIAIDGAWIREPVDLEGASIEASVYLVNSRFEDDVTLRGVRSTGNVGFDGSHLPRDVNLDGAEIGGNLLLRGAHVGSVDATTAVFASNVELSRSTFTGVVDLGVTDVGGGLFANGSTFRREFRMTTAHVAGAMWAVDAVFHADLVMEGMRSDASVLLGGSDVHGEVDLSGASIGGSLALVHGEKVIDWHDDSSIRLTATTSDGMDDAPEAWPDTVHLEGFTLTHPHGQGFSELGAFMDRPSDWYLGWLRRDDGFSRGAYVHLERLLRESGRPAEADQVGMARAGRDAESSGTLEQPVALVYRYTVGYGYHPERAALWAIGFVVLGAIAASFIPRQQLDEKGASSRMVLSAHKLIPLISFGDAYSKVDTTSRAVPRYVRWYFCVHAVLGYVLAAAIVAAVSGVVSTT